MTKKILTYKGYTGTAGLNLEDSCLCGKLLFIKGLVTYEADTIDQLEKAFRESVDDYIETMEALGVEPSQPCSGTFNVRIGSELHHAAAIKAAEQDLSLNAFVKKCIQDGVDSVVSKGIVQVQLYTTQNITYDSEKATIEERPNFIRTASTSQTTH